MIINKHLGIKNIFLNGFLTFLIYIFGSLLGVYIIPKYKRKQINNSSSITLIICSLFLMIMNLISNTYKPYSKRHNIIRLIETGKIN